MKHLVADLENGTADGLSSSDIMRSLRQFQKSVNPDVCNMIKKANQISFFQRIWIVLFKCAVHESVSVRLASYTATTSFLMKLIPYFSNEIRKSFSYVTTNLIDETKNSIMLIASFAFISNYLARPFMEEFLIATPIYHHFIVTESISSEHLSNVIKNLGDLPESWLITLLASFLKQNASNPCRLVMSAIVSVVSKNPKKLLPTVFKSSQLPLVAYALITLDINLDDFDLYNIAKDALKNLSTSDVAHALDSFHILSSQSKSFKVDVNVIDDKSLEITLSNAQEAEKLTIEYQQYLEQPSFYLLPLPKSFLLPHKEDTSAIVSSKFKSFAKRISDSNEIIDIEEDLDLMAQYCKGDYNEVVAACLQCIAKCIDSLIMNCQTHKLVRILREILFVKPRSWVHAYEILHVFKVLGSKLNQFIKQNDIINTMIDFAAHPNGNLASDARNAIIATTTEATFYEVTSLISDKTDFFDLETSHKHISLLASLVRAFPKCSNKHLCSFVDLLIENIPSISYDLTILSSFFDFLACYNMSEYPQQTVNYAYTTAFAIVHTTLEVLTGFTRRIPLAESITNFYRQLVVQYIETRSISLEIVGLGCHDFKVQLPAVYSATNFLLSLSTQFVEKRYALVVIEKMFLMFPLECTNRLCKFEESERSSLVNKLYPELETISNSHVHALWCTLATNDIRMKAFMTKIALYYLKNPCQITDEDLFTMITFLAKTNKSFIPDISIFLLHLNKEKQKKFLFLALAQDPGLVATCQQEFNQIQSSIFDPQSYKDYIGMFEQLDENQKMAFLKAIINEPKPLQLDIPDEIISYGCKNLTGWSLLVFKKNLKLDYDEPVPRAFNPYFQVKLSEDSLSERMNIAIETGSKDQIKYLIAFGPFQKFEFDFKEYDFSKDTLFSVMKYLRRTNYDEFVKLASSLEDTKASDNTLVYRIIAEPNKYFERFINAEEVKRQEILYMTEAIQYLDIVEEIVFELIMKLLKSVKKEKMLTTILTFSAVALKQSSNIPKDFTTTLFQCFQEKFEILPAKEMATCVLCLSKRIKFNEEQFNYIRELTKICGISSPDLAHLQQAMIISATQSIPIVSLTGMISEYFEGDLVSQICSGFRIMSQAVETIQDSQVAEPMSPFVIKAFNIIRQFRKSPAINFYFSILIKTIIRSSLSSLYTTVLDHMHSSFPPSNIPAFLEFSQILTPFTESLDPNSSDLDVTETILRKMLKKPLSFYIFKTFTEILDKRLSKFTRREDQSKFLTNQLNTWFTNFNSYDSYNITLYLDCIYFLMKKYFTPEERLEYVSSSIMIMKIRFFPLFHHLVKVVLDLRETKAQLTNTTIDGTIELIRKFENIPSRLVALKILKEGGNISEALDLALIDSK